VIIAETRIGGLSWPSKMPCPSWSISARLCNTGGKLSYIPDSVCAGCYAKKGYYVFPAAAKAMQRRYEILADALMFHSARRDFINDFSETLQYYATRKRGKRYTDFRWHDSGDLQSVTHLGVIKDIAELNPNINFWLPTKEYRILDDFHKTDSLPENLTVRVSAFLQNAVYQNPKAKWGSSMVYSNRDCVPPDAYLCPVGVDPKRKSCEDCRACWSKTSVVAYALH